MLVPGIFFVQYFRFSRLDLEGQRRCSYDYVAAYEGDTTNRTEEIGRYCGNQTQTPPILKSRGNVMTVQFKTDYSVTGGGYDISNLINTIN